MVDIVKLILGEADAKLDTDEKEKKPKAEKTPEPKPSTPKGAPTNSEAAPEDAEIDELANLWSQGNRLDVTQRFAGMDNETAVKLVFAIGREGALELARMADDVLEQQGEEDQGAPLGDQDMPVEDEEALPGEDAATTEPASVESPQDAQGYPTRQILGTG